MTASRAQALGARAGRVLLSLQFLKGGFDQLREPGGRVQKAADLGLPKPDLAVRVNGAVMLAGGAVLATGVCPRPAALALVAALVPTTIAGHPFWKFDGPDRAQQLTHFLKNTGLAGGLLVAAS